MQDPSDTKKWFQWIKFCVALYFFVYVFGQSSWTYRTNNLSQSMWHEAADSGFAETRCKLVVRLSAEALRGSRCCWLLPLHPTVSCVPLRRPERRENQGKCRVVGTSAAKWILKWSGSLQPFIRLVQMKEAWKYLNGGHLPCSLKSRWGKKLSNSSKHNFM